MKKSIFKPLAVAICAVALFSCNEETVVSPEIEMEKSLGFSPCYDGEGTNIPCKDTWPEHK